MRGRLIIMRMSLCAKKLPAPAKSKPRSLVQHRSKLGFGDGTLDCSAFKEKSYWAHSSAAEPHCSHAYRPIDWNRRGNERRLLPASRQETRAAQRLAGRADNHPTIRTIEPEGEKRKRMGFCAYLSDFDAQAKYARCFLRNSKTPPARSSIEVTVTIPKGNSGTGIAGSGPQLLQPCMLHLSLAWT